ncbi:protein-glutamate O-methyltransferase CheR [Pontixanthobacter gangjinensis]|uniref:Methyltransferase domain-containing protein n=1 Tax=Pontixanthobacter gangjinensis TaxID=1028742 RepID=A0A6I4SS72_9SPHN|nr:protein-glutamate O-methyltransferase CheR [Pontixanthobacter gangjinensis]MXO57836.1 methyltransferase domain-containing protein [Pontixanthobacter gangjinensis]
MEVSEMSHRIIADLLLARTGQQITDSRKWRVGTALSGLFRERGITNIDQLVCLLADNHAGSLSQEVVEALLNNETYFFRDRIMFELLSSSVLPDLAAKRSGTKRISIWSAGCSTGQEALSLAMLFADQPERWKDWTIDIVGTDVSQRAINAAQRACFTQFEIQRGLSVTQMLSHFQETSAGWEPNDALRRMVRFKQRNLLDPAQIPHRFDLVLCRNVMLYFDASRRKKAFSRVADVTREDGWLMLGAGESVLGQTENFKAADGNQGLYVRSKPGEIARKSAPARGHSRSASR